MTTAFDSAPEVLEATARAVHEANRAFCIAIGDDSQVSWDEAPDWQKDAAYAGVEGIANGDSPEQSHERWVQGKIDAGWVLGDVKDPEAKTHPAMLPYAQLPREQQAKDHIFSAVVHAMMAAFSD